jgi:hypothetical protein
VTGLYLRGGLGFGEWVAGKSDVDFTATLARRPDDHDLRALRSAHEAVSTPKAPALDGVHVFASDLARPPDECPDMPAVRLHGFEAASRFDLSPVPWHELARHGVTFSGTPVAELDVWTDDEVLRRFTIDNLDTYWRHQADWCAADPERASDPLVCEWVVPGVARLHHLLMTGRQTSKALAVRWGLEYCPERFHRVLRESLAIRQGAFEEQYADVVERGRDVAAFAAYVVERGTG